MDDLKQYVDQLFCKYKHNLETDDLKEEILSNLIAKKTDLMANGYEESTALIKAKESITCIDNLIDGNLNIYKKQFELEIMQRIIIYFLIAGIIIIPFGIFRSGIIINILIFGTLLGTACIYIMERMKKDIEHWNNTSYISLNKLNKMNKYGWVIWGIFMVLSMLETTGMHFASNIWYHRNVVIDGPYQWAVLVTDYIIPFITIIIPLLLQSIPKIAMKYEVKNHD